jgi:aubergine
MVSQNVTVGTVCPTYYHVLEDKFCENRADVLHKITYQLCHSYFNWSGTIRIPSVVQYAKKLAFLTGQYLNSEPTLDIPADKQLYFL